MWFLSSVGKWPKNALTDANSNAIADEIIETACISVGYPKVLASCSWDGTTLILFLSLLCFYALQHPWKMRSQEADFDCSGTLDKEEFVEICGSA